MNHHRAFLNFAPCLTLITACTAMRQVPLGQLRSQGGPDSVFVTEADHSTVVLHAPRVVGDTLKGTVEGVGVYGTRRQFLLSQTTAIQTKELAPVRTVALVLGLVAIPVTYVAIKNATRSTPLCLPGAADCMDPPLPGTICCG
jgi:hypothetical protein